jgi:hypothetical protein
MIGAATGKEVAYELAEPQAFRDDFIVEGGLPCGAPTTLPL